jgi:hypothetical protein
MIRTSGESWNPSFLNFVQVAFSADQEAGSESTIPGDPFKRRIHGHAQVSFFLGQGAENELPWPCTPLKHRFLELAKVAFWAG